MIAGDAFAWGLTNHPHGPAVFPWGNGTEHYFGKVPDTIFPRRFEPVDFAGQIQGMRAPERCESGRRS